MYESSRCSLLEKGCTVEITSSDDSDMLFCPHPCISTPAILNNGLVQRALTCFGKIALPMLFAERKGIL